MVHLLVFVAVVDSDDLFLITTFIVFALEGKEDICMEREFLHLHLQHASHFQGGVYRGKKGSLWKTKEGSLGVNSSIQIIFRSLVYILLERSNKA